MDDFSVNIKEIDNQHRQLIEIVNQLHRAMREGKSSQMINDIINRLIDYTQYHFETEERLMEAYNFPGYVHHKAEHAKLTRQVQEFQRQYRQNPMGLSVQLLNFLKSWVADHILQTDKQYTRFLNNQGVF
ncbi:MAG: hemerythrin [Anaerolineae bacterium]|nr:MAG: hemerythrin [Anaerolineae bacterium]